MRHWGKKGFDDLSLDVHKNISQGEWTVARTYSDNELLTQKQPLDNNANIYTNWKERWQQRSSIFCTLKTIKNKIGQKEWVVSSSKPFHNTNSLLFSFIQLSLRSNVKHDYKTVLALFCGWCNGFSTVSGYQQQMAQADDFVALFLFS